MPTLLRARSQDGTTIGRCGQHCYQSHSDTSSCICGGINHKVGLAQARKNLPLVIRHLIETWTGPGPLYLDIHETPGADRRQTLFHESTPQAGPDPAFPPASP